MCAVIPSTYMFMCRLSRCGYY